MLSKLAGSCLQERTEAVPKPAHVTDDQNKHVRAARPIATMAVARLSSLFQGASRSHCWQEVGVVGVGGDVVQLVPGSFGLAVLDRVARFAAKSRRPLPPPA
jgi:hypothetical protein